MINIVKHHDVDVWRNSDTINPPAIRKDRDEKGMILREAWMTELLFYLRSFFASAKVLNKLKGGGLLIELLTPRTELQYILRSVDT